MLLFVVLGLASLGLIGVEVLRIKRSNVKRPDLNLNHRASEELIRQVEAWQATKDQRRSN